MDNKKHFYIVEADVLPEIVLKVMEAKSLMEREKIKTVREAVDIVGISRSAFYKYKDSVFPFYENTRSKTVTLAANLDDTPGVLSNVLNIIASYGANILTINQNIPINRIANVTITIEANNMSMDMSTLIDKLKQIEGVLSLKIIARE